MVMLQNYAEIAFSILINELLNNVVMYSCALLAELLRFARKIFYYFRLKQYYVVLSFDKCGLRK